MVEKLFSLKNIARFASLFGIELSDPERTGYGAIFLEDEHPKLADRYETINYLYTKFKTPAIVVPYKKDFGKRLRYDDRIVFLKDILASKQYDKLKYSIDNRSRENVYFVAVGDEEGDYGKKFIPLNFQLKMKIRGLNKTKLMNAFIDMIFEKYKSIIKNEGVDEWMEEEFAVDFASDRLYGVIHVIVSEKENYLRMFFGHIDYEGKEELIQVETDPHLRIDDFLPFVFTNLDAFDRAVREYVGLRKKLDEITKSFDKTRMKEQLTLLASEKKRS